VGTPGTEQAPPGSASRTIPAAVRTGTGVYPITEAKPAGIARSGS
jgi:hypothetical protein